MNQQTRHDYTQTTGNKAQKPLTPTLASKDTDLKERK